MYNNNYDDDDNNDVDDDNNDDDDNSDDDDDNDYADGNDNKSFITEAYSCQLDLKIKLKKIITNYLNSNKLELLNTRIV